MNKIVLFLLLLLAISLQAFPSYFVLNGLGETISCGSYDHEMYNDIITTGSMPNQIDYDYFLGDVWVLSSGDASLQKFEIIDDYEVALVEEFFMPSGSNPYLMYRDGDKFYISLWVSGNFAVIDETAGRVDVYEPELLGAQGIFADEDYIYVTASNFDPITFEYGDGELWRFDHDGEAVDHINIGCNPQEIISPDFETLHIVCTGDYMGIAGAVYIVEKESFAVIDSVNVGGAPSRLSFDPHNDLVFSVTSVWGEHGSGRILAYDAVTYDLLFSESDTANAVSGTGLVGLDAYAGVICIPSMDSSFMEIVYLDPLENVFEHEATVETGYGPQDVSCRHVWDVSEQPIPKSDIDGRIEIYPNPFRRSCQIESSAPSNIEIVDINGRRIDLIENSTIPGNDRLSVSVWTPDKDVNAGVYFARYIDGEYDFSKKIVYIR